MKNVTAPEKEERKNPSLENQQVIEDQKKAKKNV
jgi:hypothetical protein